MKDIKSFVIEKLTVNSKTKLHDNSNFNNTTWFRFKEYLKKFNVFMTEPDSSGISYITPSEDEEIPSICIMLDNKYWTCYLSDEEEGKIYVSLDEEGEADEEIDTDEFNKIDKGFAYSEDNAELLAQGLLEFKK